MYTRLMSGFKKFFATTYNLGRAIRPRPLPNTEVRLADQFEKLEKSDKKISKASLQATFAKVSGDDQNQSASLSQ